MKNRSKYYKGIAPFKAPDSWSKKSKYYDVKQSDALIGIKVESHNETFTIPIVDVTKSYSQRERAEEMIKENNIQRGSRFFKPSFSVLGHSYNNSRKS